MKEIIGSWISLICMAMLFSCSGDQAPASTKTSFFLDANASGVIEKIHNIVNMSIVSRDANDLKAEYKAGYIQGKLQGNTILSARDNMWDLSYLLDPSHSFPKQHGPTQDELDQVAALLNGNYNGMITHLRNITDTDAEVAYRLKRLVFRLLGIYHGVTLEQPAALDFSGDWLPDDGYFKPEELDLGYENATLTFMDLYFLNAYNDVMDVISFSSELVVDSVRPTEHPDKCSAFLKRSGNEVILTHNSWMGFLSQTMTQTLAVNDDLVTMNSISPGQIGSSTDFGYNNKGILFSETTHRMSKGRARANGIWMFWRAALAEQFASSLDEFFEYISLSNTGTYLNGYMLVDAKNNETGLVEMSYRCFVYYRSNGGDYTVATKSLDAEACSSDYDTEMVTPDYIMGINYPASLQVRTDLASTDNRPARRRQFKALLPGVTDLESAKAVITYTDPLNPLSIFGRWDLGYGETSYPKQVPDGAVDAKVASTAMVRNFMGLAGILDLSAPTAGFWMLYGTPYVNCAPFIWSKSSWASQKLRDVPDRVDGSFTLMPLYLR
jgi:hypothetical protein